MWDALAMEVHLVDGTYELFRHHFGQPAGRDGSRSPYGATRGVLAHVIGLLERGVSHLGVATDTVVESFRNQLWPAYKRGDGVPPELAAQFPLFEAALEALGVTLWAMVELEADDALASAAAVLCEDPAVHQVRLATPDKDLAQCVRGQRVVQFDSRSGACTDESGVRARFGIGPRSIPDWLALVGDSADGFPGLPGWGRTSASTVLAHYHHLEAIPEAVSDWDPTVRASVRSAARLAGVLAAQRDLAGLFKHLATLRIDRSLLSGTDALSWRGPRPDFAELCATLGAPRLAERALQLAER